VVVEAALLFGIDAKQRRQQRVLVVQQPARVGVLAGVLEQPVEARLIATPQCPPKLRPVLFDGS